MLAPIVLFTYSRLPETIQTIEALKKNHLASKSQLFIFSDGPKNENTLQNVMAVRKYIRTIDGFKSVEIVESKNNKGLAESVISGVNSILSRYSKIIVLEDDLITSSNFLNFMNQALEYYQNHEAIFSVSGFTLDLPALKKYNKDYYLGYRASSWGWATWQNRWATIDWTVPDYKYFIINPIEHYKFMKGGSDLPYMLWKQMNGKIDSWAIRWCFHQFKNKQLTVFPSKSKVQNIGFSNTATHTRNLNRFQTVLDWGEKRKFVFNEKVILNKMILKELRKEFSVAKRLKGILNG